MQRFDVVQVRRLWERTRHRKRLLNRYRSRPVDDGYAKRAEAFIAQGQIDEQFLVIFDIVNDLNPYFSR